MDELEWNIEKTIRKYGWNREEVLSSLNKPYEQNTSPALKDDKPMSRFQEYMHLRKLASLRRRFDRVGHEGYLGRAYKTIRRLFE